MQYDITLLRTTLGHDEITSKALVLHSLLLNITHQLGWKIGKVQ